MPGCSRIKIGVKSLVAVFAVATIGTVGVLSCGTAPTAFLVRGPGGVGNIPPELTILQPITNLTRGQGDPFVISWTDSDPDDNATISFDLVNTNTSSVVSLISGIPENDQVGTDTVTIGTGLIPVGSYNLRGTIDDLTNDPVVTFARTTGAAPQRVVIQVVEAGQGIQSQPPAVAIAQPLFDLSVTQDDVVTVVVVPSLVTGRPFDRDSDMTLYLVLDLDQNPNNDDPANPDPSEIIVLAQRNIAQNTTEPVVIDVVIDLTTIPPRPNGEPYFIRATADDSTNPRVHQYAVGQISVTQLAAGVVDLSQVGSRLSGSRFYGFNPGANAGSTIQTITDFDGDGISDFVIVAQFGNPRNAGLVGEAYLVYGLDQVRFGGAISVNSVAETVSGVIFEAPPIRRFPNGLFQIPGVPRSDGITDVNFLPDYTGDGRPELIFGLPHVHGAYDSMDFDPADQNPDQVGDEVTIEVALRQGRVSITEGDGNPAVTSTVYSMEDTTISTASPNASLGAAASLDWQDTGDGTKKWVLIKFADVLEEIPDNPFNIAIDTVQATLELRVFDIGGEADAHQALTDFSEQTTYASYAVNGGDPEPDTDFVTEPEGQNGALDSASGDSSGIVEVDVTVLVQRLIDGLLDDSDNEIRIILVPDAGNAADQTSVRSSEFSNADDRPTLRITYDRVEAGSALGCYPDLLVNNRTDTGGQDPVDTQFYAGGMAAIVNSTNRDNSGPINTDRLEATSVHLELAGARVPFPLDAQGTDRAGGDIFPLADNVASGDNIGNEAEEGGRIAGARVVGGPFDFEDHLQLRQPAREGLFGQSVGFLGDVDNDGFGEIVVSAPRNERYVQDLLNTFGFQSTHWQSTTFEGSILVLPGTNYNDPFWRDINDESGTCTLPFLDHHRVGPFGSCQAPISPRHQWIPAGSFEVFAENIDDMLGGAGSSGDFNQDGLDDLLCGAFRNDRQNLRDTGAVYILYTRNVISDFDLKLADDPIRRTPMLRIRGVNPGDQLGWKQVAGRDVNGDRVDDVFISSPRTDFGGITRSSCGGDFNGDGAVDQGTDLNILTFSQCQQDFGDELFLNDPCKVFDYDNDNDIDDDDRCVFCCLSDDCEPENACVFGRGTDCCENLADNGFAAVIFGGRFLDGDRLTTQIGTTDLPGVIFFGGSELDRVGMDISSAGDFNQDGFGDILIAAPGESRRDTAGRLRVGVVYLIFGGTHLTNRTFNLSDPERGVGSVELPGIVFLSPYVAGRPNEAAPTTVGLLGDINSDGFDDIAIGNPKADFIDLSFPQGPDAPGSDAAAGRRRDAGDAYIIYGSNFGSNRGAP